jgi:hypothetical protein
LDGAEYEFRFQGSDNRFALYHWNGTSWSWVPASSAAVSFAGGLSVTLSLSDLGSPTGFNFWTWTGQLPDINAEGHYDNAPDSETWNYRLAGSAPPKIVSVLVEQKPLLPKAGKAFKLIVDGLKVDPSEGFVLPHPDTVACTAKLNGKRLAGGGLGGCTWKLPAGAKGKRLTLGVTVTYRGARATFALGTERVG